MSLYDAIEARAAEHRLAIMGEFLVEDDPTLPPHTRTLLLLGPAEPGFWPHLQAQPEWDGEPDPVDRWSRRVIGLMACELGGKALFPFGGPPWHPFMTWAKRTGRAWESPVRLLVHDVAGLFVSYRGALALREAVDLPPPSANPCDNCPTKPCLTACPPRALTGDGYDVPACHAFLDTPPGDTCLSGGCWVRAACPVSQAHARLPEQSAYHMRQFHR